VTRLSRAIKSTAEDGTPQIVFYHRGVGTDGTALDSVIGGDFGAGLALDIRELYYFICTNYADGDEIVLVGFSRGAFTARSVGDMIAAVGLLTFDGLDHFAEIFQDYENLGEPARADEDFLLAGLPAYNGQKGKARIVWEETRRVMYRQWLQKVGYF
jgi:uncharacterized protein (DUF2235 family)